MYWTVRFGEIALLGDNASAWHALILALGLVAACLLYAAARALAASRVAAALLGGWLLVAPARRALERNDEAIPYWLKRRWPQLKKERGARTR